MELDTGEQGLGLWRKFKFGDGNKKANMESLMGKLREMQLAEGVDLHSCPKRTTSKVRWHTALEGCQLEQAHVVAHPAVRSDGTASGGFDAGPTHWYSICFEDEDEGQVLRARDKFLELLPELKPALQQWQEASYPEWLVSLEQ